MRITINMSDSDSVRVDHAVLTSVAEVQKLVEVLYAASVEVWPEQSALNDAPEVEDRH